MNQKVLYNANYTYDADGQRIVRYVPGRLDAFYSANQAGHNDRLERFIYPNGLLTVKTLPKMNVQLKMIATYTKHYYVGSERVSSVIGRGTGIGQNLIGPCDSFPSTQDIFMMNNEKVQEAEDALQDDYQFFEKQLVMSESFSNRPGCFSMGYVGEHNAYWFHPDHLGSSSYISNLNKEISQHLEYFPFGETLVEEHKNSNNSPYKFNGKELDDETGNYYYGARYLNPKFSIWLSVDPLAEKYPNISPYAYTFHNPIKYVDPDGRDGIIYLVLLNSADRSQVNEMVQKTNSRMEDMGLRTRVQVYTGPAETFDRRNLDKTDSFGVIGNKAEINTLLNESPERFAGISEKGNSKKSRNDFTPELADRTSSLKRGTGLGFLIKTDVMKEKAKEISESNSSFGSFLMMHALGHNSGLGHISKGSIIMSNGGILGNTFNPNGLYYNNEGKRITGKLNIQNFEQLFNKELNTKYIKVMEERFGSYKENGAASDNYFKNLRSIGPRDNRY